MRPAQPLIFLDEITYLEDWYLFLKELAESAMAFHSIVLATGSSPAKIKRNDCKDEGLKETNT